MDKPLVTEDAASAQEKPPPTVRESLIEFCEKTTTRGLSRAVKETSTVWKVIWYAATVLLLLFAIVQVSELMNSYLEFQVIQEENTGSEVKYPFPSVTVCNLNPIRDFDRAVPSAAAQNLPPYLYSRASFYDYVRKLQTLFPKARATLEKVKSTVGFFHNLPPVVQEDFGHSQTDFINSCQVVISKGFNVYRTFECDDFRVVRSPLFFNCYTVYTNTSHSDEVATLSLVLYLNENEVVVTPESASTQDLFGLYLGAKMVIHEADSFPDIDHASIKVGPGVSAWTVLQTKRWTKLGEPYEPCLDAKALNVTIEHNNTAMHYSRLGCRMSCMQRSVVEECGCLNPAWPMRAEYIDKYPYCMNISANLTQFQERMDCWIKVEEEKGKTDCKDNCHETCDRYIYGQSMWTSKWPYVSNHLAFYDRYIKGKPYEAKFKVYEKLQEVAKTNATYVSRELKNLDLIERNFLQINVHRNFELRTITERPAYGRDQLFSGVGGILSLSIGITLITIVEVIQLFYKLCLALRQRLRESKAPAAEKSVLDNEAAFPNGSSAGDGSKYSLFPGYGATTK